MGKLARMLWLACCLLGSAARAADEVVGMVLDVQGGGELLDKGQSSRLQLLGYLKRGVQLRLDSGARVSVSHYGAKLIYQLNGPLLAEVDAGELRVLKGAAPATKSLAEKVVQAALGANTGPAAYKMRAMMQELVLLGPRNGSVVLGTRPSFRWESSEPALYRLTLHDAAGQPLLEIKTDNPAWQPADGQALASGQSYRWSVSYTSAVDGVQHSASAQFSVVGEAERAALTALRPGADAGVDELVLYATLLQNRQMLDDARLVWAEIAARRPDLSKAGSLAR